MKALLPLTLLASLISASVFAATYSEPQPLVAPSEFKGVHGLAVDHQGRLLAGSVVGNSIYQVDPDSGNVSTFIGPDLGQADDIAIGPNGEMAWTGFYSGQVLYRENDAAPIRVLAEGKPGINSIAFNQQTGQLFASQVFLGDALWEIDVKGEAEPRLIKQDMGGFNGFEVGSDGWIYGPLWFKGQVVKINPADGEMAIVADGFGTPAAVNFDSTGKLYVVDTLHGQLMRIDTATGDTELVAELDTALDNLAIDAQDRIYVSNMADNGISQVDPNTGEERVITQGELAVPAGIALAEDGETLYVSDVFAFRSVNTTTGEVKDIRRAHGSDIEYPIAVGLSKTRLLLTSFSTGTLHLINRDDHSTIRLIHGLNAPSDAIELPDGSIVVSELATGSLVHLSGEKLDEKRTLADGLQGPVQMILGNDGQIYLTEAAGFLTRVNPDNGEVKHVTEGLLMPEGLAQMTNGDFVIAETAAQRLIILNAETGERKTLADNLPIGFPAGPGMPPSGIPTGVAVAADGTVYFTSDVNNGLYKIELKLAEN
ncbi:SMP-30/gluconolactonase/LRE family protein [Halopseudomonas pelagia]|uniref:Vgb family protein n=1 Tax=Halopseudomonas pelagia TaxID=553151 RepID=UPI0030DB3B24|tara:strand:+ start:2941 stop:4563 length:1623 start_codon:yes stop_codon:yes gene_type:complete